MDAVRKFRRRWVALHFVCARFSRAHCCARLKFGSEHLQGVSVTTAVDRGGLMGDVARWGVCVVTEELCRDVTAQHNCETFVSWPCGGSVLSWLLTRQNRSCSGFEIILALPARL